MYMYGFTKCEQQCDRVFVRFVDPDRKVSDTEAEPNAFRRHLFHDGHPPIRREGESTAFL